MTEEEELRKYFPGVPSTAVFCVGCASHGHKLRECPLRRDAKVRSDGVPSEPSANDYSAAVPLQDMQHNSRQCQRCASHGHETEACPQLWRVYNPSADQCRKVQSLPKFCYFCGNAGHWGGDCKWNSGEHLSGRTYSLEDDIWTDQYSQKFVDVTSDQLCKTAQRQRPQLADMVVKWPSEEEQRRLASAEPLREVTDGGNSTKKRNRNKKIKAVKAEGAGNETQTSQGRKKYTDKQEKQRKSEPKGTKKMEVARDANETKGKKGKRPQHPQHPQNPQNPQQGKPRKQGKKGKQDGVNQQADNPMAKEVGTSFDRRRRRKPYQDQAKANGQAKQQLTANDD